ncbi:hypothetical protein [Burkholderia stagnalis]
MALDLSSVKDWVPLQRRELPVGLAVSSEWGAMPATNGPTS